MSGGRGSGRAPLAEINVTPLVDVFLVLLVIFMVSTPLMTAGIEVDLPRADAPDMPLETEKILLVIDEDERVWLRAVGTDQSHEEPNVIPYERLLEVLSTNAVIQDTHELYLQADEDVSYGFVARILAIARQAGVESLGLVTDPRGERPPIPARPVQEP